MAVLQIAANFFAGQPAFDNGPINGEIPLAADE